MELSGGSWIWSASLRYFFMIPFLLLIVFVRGNLKQLWHEMRSQPAKWFIWSFVGFVLFYGPLCFAAAYGPGWLIAGTWQITIISGSLLAPLFYETVHTQNGPLLVRGKVPWRGMAMSLLILAGVVVLQFQQAHNISAQAAMIGILPVVVASFAYPLGNRKMMEVCAGRMDSYQRVLGMTLATVPVWLLLSVYAWFTVGPPSSGQTLQSLIVAVSSGVIATVLFFRATDMVQGNMGKLAAVEATQSMEVLFAVVGEVALLAAPLPSLLSSIGMILVIAGMILHSYKSHKQKPVQTTNNMN